MVRGWEAPGGRAGVAMAEEKEPACLPEAMRSCPTMGGCDLTSPGTGELPPPKVGNDSSCHHPEPPAGSAQSGARRGAGGSPLKILVTSVFSLPPRLSLPPWEVGCPRDLAAIWVPHWLCLEPGTTSGRTPGAPACAPVSIAVPESPPSAAQKCVLISAGALPAVGAPSSSPAPRHPVPSASLTAPSGSPSGSILFSLTPPPPMC